MGYSPSPRPTFDRPTALRFDEVVRHTWGDDAAGKVDDWIYVSSSLLHTIIFGMDPGDRFVHSEDFRTVFGADEVLHVLQGTLALANPETGEVVRVEPGESVFFRKDTWHHGFSYGADPVRVLEFFAPPPATGTSGPYARTRPYLDESNWRYSDDGLRGTVPGAVSATRPTLHLVRPCERKHALRDDALVGLIARTEHLVVEGVRLVPGGRTATTSHDGDVLVFVEQGEVEVTTTLAGIDETALLGRWDALYLPRGAAYTLCGAGQGPTDLVVGSAPGAAWGFEASS